MKRGSSGLDLVLGVNKPLGMSSHDVVDAVRRALGERRVGHAGTLDPAADGVLVVGVGQGTRLMGLLTADQKSYLASITFGFETTTDDAEGEPTRFADVLEQLCDEGYARDVLSSFVGEQDQVPPAYSAISVNGKRSYARARAGEKVELEPRRVKVSVAQLLSVETERAEGTEAPLVRWQCAFTVSKGTYVRALARDIGRRANSAAHLSQLCRTASGTVTLAQCTTLETIAELGAKGIERVALDPVTALGLPIRRLEGREVKDVSCGRRIEARDVPYGQSVALVSDGKLVGVWESDGNRLFAKTNFARGIVGVRA
ncbi:MAG: tRNA pseudouridine(55) synthase TruB [Atopobiaceae bacterium]|nr:tRNA pseudouridine(55) synthase TruB [Atopobiaceae bacterium]